MRLFPVLFLLLIGPTLVIAQIENAPKQGSPAKTKLEAFLSSVSTTIVSKKIKFSKVFGPLGSFEIECFRSYSTKSPQTIFRGVLLYAEKNNKPGSISSGFEADELPSVVSAIRSLMKDAVPFADLDFGDLGKERVFTTHKVVTNDGTIFGYDDSSGGFFLIIEGEMFSAHKELFTTLADSLERASKLLKKLGEN